MKVTIDRDVCTGCELCTTLCADVFEMGSDNLAQVKAGANPDACADAVKEATSSCPVECIKITE